MQVNTLCTGGSCEGSPHTFWSSLRVPTSSPPSASLSPANYTLSSLSFCACGVEQTTVFIPAQMPPREQVVIARHCPFCFTPVQWNKLCRCSWGNTSQAAPLHDGPLLPLSSHYPVVEPPVAGTPEQLQEALLQVGVTLVKTGEFLKAVPGSSSHPQRSITRSSRAATTRAVPMPSLDQIRNPQNTTWVAIINESLDDLGPRLRKTSLISEDDWQGTGAVWLKGALEPQVLNNSTWLGNNFTGPRVSSLSVEAQDALQAAEAGGLILERNASITGFRGVVRIANKAKPFQGRLYRIDGPGKKRARVTRGSFGSPEEAALHYAKLLKFEDTVYSANAS